MFCRLQSRSRSRSGPSAASVLTAINGTGDGAGRRRLFYFVYRVFRTGSCAFAMARQDPVPCWYKQGKMLAAVVLGLSLRMRTNWTPTAWRIIRLGSAVSQVNSWLLPTR